MAILKHTRSNSAANARSSGAALSHNGNPQTPWRRISRGIAQAFKHRNRVALQEGNATGQLEPSYYLRRINELVNSPTHLRAMKKTQLQNVATILNESLPPNRHIDIWRHSKEELRDAIEEALSLPRNATPQAPRRSSELGKRFSELSENKPPVSPITPMLLAPRRPRHSTGSIFQPKPSLSFDTDSDDTVEFPSYTKHPGGSLKLQSQRSGSRARPLGPASNNSPISPRNLGQFPRGELGHHRSPRRSSESSTPTRARSSSPPSSPLASRSTHGSISRIFSDGLNTPNMSRSNSNQTLATSASGMSIVSPSNSRSRISGHSRSSTTGSIKEAKANSVHAFRAEDLTLALLTSRAGESDKSDGGSSSSKRPTHSRSRSTLTSAYGSRRFLDVVREEDGEDEGNMEEGPRPKKRRRALEPFSASSGYTFGGRREYPFHSLASMSMADFSMKDAKD
ncbi:hypothetical protein FRB99_005670 [Tulasnella sp. 403]|nr:hypothetical protein FRB99_005670 [Tulasnella sp. 403]